VIYMIEKQLTKLKETYSFVIFLFGIVSEDNVKGTKRLKARLS